MSYPTPSTLEVECEACEGTGIYEDEMHMHTIVKIVRLDCVECEGSGSIEMEIAA